MKRKSAQVSEDGEKKKEMEDENDFLNSDTGNWIQQESCNVRNNTHLSSGYLHLSAKYQPYLNFNYTSATLTSKFSFTYGRVEVRASNPLGRQLRTTVFTVNSNDVKWHDNGQIVWSSQQDNVDYRVFYAGSDRSNDSRGITHEQSKFTEHMNEFHLFGWEWSKEEIRFFFDDIYEKPWKFNGMVFISFPSLFFIKH